MRRSAEKFPVEKKKVNQENPVYVNSERKFMEKQGSFKIFYK